MLQVAIRKVCLRRKLLKVICSIPSLYYLLVPRVCNLQVTFLASGLPSLLRVAVGTAPRRGCGTPTGRRPPLSPGRVSAQSRCCPPLPAPQHLSHHIPPGRELSGRLNAQNLKRVKHKLGLCLLPVSFPCGGAGGWEGRHHDSDLLLNSCSRWSWKAGIHLGREYCDRNLSPAKVACGKYRTLA